MAVLAVLARVNTIRRRRRRTTVKNVVFRDNVSRGVDLDWLADWLAGCQAGRRTNQVKRRLYHATGRRPVRSAIVRRRRRRHYDGQTRSDSDKTRRVESPRLTSATGYTLVLLPPIILVAPVEQLIRRVRAYVSAQ